MKEVVNIKGTGVAMITPFTKEGEVDTAALENLTNYLINNGVDYLVVMGTTGESATLNSTEKSLVMSTVAKANSGRVPLVLGVGGNNTLEVSQAVRSVAGDAYSAILSVSPYYNKPGQQGIIRHYTMIADASPLPVILYNVPGRTQSNMLAETTLALAAHENIIGMKEASGNMEQAMQIAKYAPADFTLISGDDNLTLPLLSVGFHGVISVSANAYPALMSKLVKHARANELPQAREAHYRLFEITQLMFAEGNPAGVKYILHRLGMIENELRLPLTGVSDTLRAAIDAKLQEI